MCRIYFIQPSCGCPAFPYIPVSSSALYAAPPPSHPPLRPGHLPFSPRHFLPPGHHHHHHNHHPQGRHHRHHNHQQQKQPAHRPSPFPRSPAGPALGPGPELCQAARLRAVHQNRLRHRLGGFLAAGGGGGGVGGFRLPQFPQACPREQWEEHIRYSGRPCPMCVDGARERRGAGRKEWRERVAVEFWKEREREREINMEMERRRRRRRRAEAEMEAEMKAERFVERERERGRGRERARQGARPGLRNDGRPLWHVDNGGIGGGGGGWFGCDYNAGNNGWMRGRGQRGVGGFDGADGRGVGCWWRGGTKGDGGGRRPAAAPATDSNLRRWTLDQIFLEAAKARRRERAGMLRGMGMDMGRGRGKGRGRDRSADVDMAFA